MNKIEFFFEFMKLISLYVKCLVLSDKDVFHFEEHDNFFMLA